MHRYVVLYRVANNWLAALPTFNTREQADRHAEHILETHPFYKAAKSIFVDLTED